jgi:hypothetical protein
LSRAGARERRCRPSVTTSATTPAEGGKPQSIPTHQAPTSSPERDEIGAKTPEHGIAQQQRQPEGAENLGQHRPLHHAADQSEIDDDAQRRQHQCGNRRAQKRPDTEQRPDHERHIHAEHDEIAMGEVDDVHHAPD